jgi:hypothetical protein
MDSIVGCYFDNLHGFERHVLVAPEIACFDCGNGIDNIHSVHDFTKYRVTEIAAAVIQEVVVMPG